MSLYHAIGEMVTHVKEMTSPFGAQALPQLQLSGPHKLHLHLYTAASHSDTMIPRLRASQVRPLRSFLSRNAFARRTITAAPRPGAGPLMERRGDRQLPSVANARRWMRTIPVFIGIMILSSLAIFNYQKANSSIVSSTLYALRTNAQARQILGDEVYFASKVPWIWGEMNQLHGRIDIKFWVKGTQGKAMMRFHSERKFRLAYVSQSSMEGQRRV